MMSKSFSKALSKFAKQAGDQADTAVKKILFDLTSGIIYSTPVETGRLRANWMASVGAPLRIATTSADPSGAATLAMANGAIQKAPGQIFWLTNNLPYAYKIEYEGWSRVKAPAGMVRINIERVRAGIQ